jgi:Repeat of unknown function (DUF5648)
MKKQLLTLLGSALFALIATVHVNGATSPLPSCAVDPGLAANVAEADLVRVSVDSHGNFFAPVIIVELLDATALDRFGVQYWTRRMWAEGFMRVKYVTTETLESNVCTRGKKIVFDERRFGSREFGRIFDAVTPKPYLEVRELAGIEFGIYFLSSVGADYDFIINGGAGRGFATTSAGFRLPRVGTDLVAVHRFYGHPSGGIGSHFFTADPAEHAAMQQRIAAGERYVYEGIAFLAPRATKRSDGTVSCSATNLTPVLRVHLSPTSADGPLAYRYTTSGALAKSMQRWGWVDQSASFCALSE